MSYFVLLFSQFHPEYLFLEASAKDYRAWYGLGQTYEILKMPYYSLYYYNEAYKLRFVQIFLSTQYSELQLNIHLFYYPSLFQSNQEFFLSLVMLRNDPGIYNKALTWETGGGGGLRKEGGEIKLVAFSFERRQDRH